MGDRLRSFLKVALLLTISLCVSGLLVEAVVLLALGEQPKFPRHVVGAPFGIRYNEPHGAYRHKSADVTVYFRINGQGMRDDREFSYDKPAGTKRIVVLGDSYTIGYEVAQDATYASVLENRLRNAGATIQVLNAGVSGFSNAEEYLYFIRELVKYKPDAVVVGYYGNDLVDNVRTGLFKLEGDQLTETADSYVPLGGVANFLNTSGFFNFLSERSNAFVLIKERATELLKKRIVKDNLRSLETAEVRQSAGAKSYEALLCAAIFEDFYKATQENKIPLVIMSIPTELMNPARLVETFPLAALDTSRPSIAFVSAKDLLDPYVGREQLYWHQSHGHWTPLSHRLAGEALADLILRRSFLGEPTTGSATGS